MTFHGPPPSSLLQWKSPKESLAKELQLMMSLAMTTGSSPSFCAPVDSLKNLSTAVSTSEDWAQARHDLVHMAVHLGARLHKLVIASQSPQCHGGDATLLDLAPRRDQTARQLLQSAIQLEASTVSLDLAASYLTWADCIKPLADLPPELYLELHDYSDASPQQLPMPDPCPPPVHLSQSGYLGLHSPFLLMFLYQPLFRT